MAKLSTWEGTKEKMEIKNILKGISIVVEYDLTEAEREIKYTIKEEAMRARSKRNK